MTTARRDYDLVTAEVHRKAVENLTEEMALAMVRTSTSPVVYEAKDFSTCFFDTVPEQLGFSGYVLFHIGSSRGGVQAIKELGEDGDLKPGDGFVTNDPRAGGAMHQADVGVIMPMFYKNDELIGWGFANLHVVDIGGVGISGYAPGAHDVFEEGLRFPPVKIIKGGRIDKEWERFIAANVRAPGPVLSDIRSMIAANNVVANQRLNAIVDEFGLEGYRELCEINKNLSEEVLRERISRLPDGVYETADWNEFDGHDGPDQLLDMRCRMTIAGDDMRFEYSGVPQIDAFVNSATHAMHGQTMSGILTTMAYGDFPINAGLWRPVTVDVGEPGTIVNSIDPAPCSNAHSEVGMRACKLTTELLAQAMSLSDDPEIRGRLAAQGQNGFPAVNLVGQNQFGNTSVVFYVDNAVGSGGGAQTIMDGQDAYGCTTMTGCGVADVETHESLDPVLWLWRRISPNSGGPGLFRGGQAIEQGFAWHYTDQMNGPGFNAVAEVPPRGFGGGYPASSGNYYPIEHTNVAELLAADKLPILQRLHGDKRTIRSKIGHLQVSRDDVQVWLSGGGGGVGDPLLRPVDTVTKDLIDGYITEKHARNAYGVVTNGDTPDIEATTKLRNEIRTERIGNTPKSEMRAPASPGVAVALYRGSGNEPHWSCGYCAADLGTNTENWRTAQGTVARQYPIFERYEHLDMHVKQRFEEPGVVLREYYCSSCAGVLGVDVATTELDVLPEPRLTEA
ncbi:hydantoinase B/oxoprolinase family protein [Sciscionella marina]|uniref:hydantoinase B/oxoprolinase family protein n=1 Tax=Sciscionella marina TaxID=508770 RepID=UPI000366C2F3|nr:hydantoinase B/oxoprolinase family protein [Sciscionella marina]